MRLTFLHDVFEVQEPLLASPRCTLLWHQRDPPKLKGSREVVLMYSV